jgi:hypothetical protein
MKKLLLSTFVLIIQTNLIFSQVSSKGDIAVTIGPALPIGNFAKTDLYNESAGFAKTGEALSLTYTKPVFKKMAFLISLSGQRNPINVTAMANAFSTAKFYDNFYLGSGVNNPPPQTNYTIYPNWKFEKKSWLYAALKIGAEGQFPLNDKNNFQLVTNLAIGVLYATAPGLKGSSITDTASAIIVQNKTTGFGLIYSFGGGLKYHLNKKIFLTSTLNFTGTNKVTFKDVTSTFTATKGAPGTLGTSMLQSTTTANGKQAFNSVNFLVGVGVSL